MDYLWFQSSSMLGWLFDSTICISILICLILTIKAFTKGRLHAWWSYGLWLLLLLRMMMPWGIESRMSIFNYLPASLENESYMPFLIEHDLSIPLIQGDFDTAKTFIVPTFTDADLAKGPADRYYDVKESSGSHFNLSLDNALLILWLTGVMLLGIKTLFKNFMFWLIISRLPSVKNKIFLDLFEKCRSSLAIQKDIAVIVTDKVKSPALFGYFKPRLLLPPQFFDTLQRDELRYVFLHELGHLKRHDILISWLVTVLQIVHWFNPCVWYAFHHLRVDQEAACDAYVLSRTKQVQPTDYANTIVSLLERFVQNRQLPSLVGIIENKSQIRRRIAMILNFKRNTLQTRFASILVFFIVGLIFFTSSSGKEGLNTLGTAIDLKEAQFIRPNNELASNIHDNTISPVENGKVFHESTDIVKSQGMLKNIEKKEAAEIAQAKADTNNIIPQEDPLILAANKKQEIPSENITPEIEEPESKPGIEYAEAVQEQESSIDYTSRGMSLLEKGQIDDAISAFNKAIELNPGNSVAYFSRGITYFKQGKNENAISDYNKAIEISPEFVAAYQNRGILYRSIGKYKKAISDYDKAIELNPENAATYNMRGIANYMKGQINIAIADYNKAIRINPEFAAPYQNRGYFYHRKGKYAKAISNYDKAIEFNPENANAYILRGHCYYYMGDYTRALSDYDKAVELNPESAVPKNYRDLAHVRSSSSRHRYYRGSCSFGNAGVVSGNPGGGAFTESLYSSYYIPPGTK